MAEDPVCPHAPSVEADNLGTKDCSSARRNLLSPSTYGLFESAWKSRGQCVTLRSLTSQSTVNFAAVTWSTATRGHLLRNKCAASSDYCPKEDWTTGSV